MATTTLFDKNGVSVLRDGDMLSLLLARGENRINPDMMDGLEGAFAAIDAAPGPKVLVVTSGDEKFFGNGLDIEWMNNNGVAFPALLMRFWKILARLLVLDCPTVCAINGHAFGAGAFMAVACDWRIMRTEKGLMNFPELNIGMRLSKPFAELAKSKLSPQTLREGILTGARWNSSTAIKAGIVDAEAPVEKLMDVAKSKALSQLPKALKLVKFNAKNFRAIKIELYTDAYRALMNGVAGANETPPEARL